MTPFASLLLIAYACIAAVALYIAWRVWAWIRWRARRRVDDPTDRAGC